MNDGIDPGAFSSRCRIRNGELTPCEYHKKRSACPMYATRRAAVVKEGRVAAAPCGDDMKALARLLRDGPEPAGGWWLLREQRDWLGNNLFHIFKNKRSGSTIRILEAGVAGCVHHYTYLAIMADALRRVDADLHISLTVVDRCALPIAQITEMDKLLTENGAPPAALRVHGESVSIDAPFADVLNKAARSLGRIHTTPVVGDLKRLDPVTRPGRFDIITEHFLPANFESRGDEIVEIRNAYTRILAPGGRLLCASNMVNDHPYHSTYEKIHRERGLEKIEKASELVWNPFSVKNELIENLLNRNPPREFDAPLVNMLSVYRKTGVSPRRSP